MATYEIVVYKTSDIDIVHTGDGNYTITIKPDATPDTITVNDTDYGDNAHVFNDGAVGDSDYSVNENQTFSGSVNGHEYEDTAISPDWTIDITGEENAMFSITLGEHNAFGGYAFTREMEPGETVELNLSDRSTINMRPEIDMDDSVACFTRGTKILAENGEILVEDLKLGDKIWTEESGYLALAWIGKRRVHALGEMVPVRISCGNLGTFEDLVVSPEHRMVLEGGMMHAVFDTKSVLVSAKHLVNGTSIIFDHSFFEVEYYHLAFDTHKTICANGALTESFFPSPQMLADAPKTQQKELLTLFPELESGISDIMTAHPVLSSSEALLVADLLN